MNSRAYICIFYVIFVTGLKSNQGPGQGDLTPTSDPRSYM